MLDKNQVVRISKFLSMVLRHRPERIGIELDAQGWTDVDTLIECCNRHGMPLDRDMLAEVVANNDKKRYAFDETQQRIRANQGHSIHVDLGYSPQQPPAILYHGTAEKHVDSIKTSGLQKRKRHHVHLSLDVPTAIQVGQRHGRPFVFRVLAGQMHEAGYAFYLSENGVWLTDHVPAKYLAPHID